MICDYCGKEFTPGKQRKYCSALCRRRSKYKHTAAELLAPKRCEVCGSEFTPISNRQKFCSKKCYKKNNAQYRHEARSRIRATRPKSLCRYCGEPFIPRYMAKNRVSEFCSMECKKAAQRKDYVASGLTRQDIDAVVYAQDFAPKGKLWELSQNWSKKQRDYAKRRYCHIHRINGHPGDY